MRLSVSPAIVSLIKVLIFLTVGFFAYDGIRLYEDIRATGTTLAAVSGTLTGFVVTGLSIMVSTADRDFMKVLRKTGHYQVLISNLVYSALCWIIVIVAGITSHFLALDFAYMAIAVGAGMFALSLINFVLAGRRFMLVITTLSRL